MDSSIPDEPVAEATDADEAEQAVASFFSEADEVRCLRQKISALLHTHTRSPATRLLFLVAKSACLTFFLPRSRAGPQADRVLLGR